MADSINYGQKDAKYDSAENYSMQQYANLNQNIYNKVNYSNDPYGNTGYNTMQFDSQQQQNNRPWRGNGTGMYQGSKKITKDFNQNQGNNFNNKRNQYQQNQNRGRFSDNTENFGHSNDRSMYKKSYPAQNNRNSENASNQQQELVPPEYQNVDLVALASSLDLNDPTQLAYYHEIANLVQKAQMQAAGNSQNSTMTNSTTSTSNQANINKTRQNQASYYKTKMCPSLLRKGECNKGPSCTFAHTDLELKKVPDLTKTKLCPIFIQQGVCPSSENCNFAHGHHELRSTAEYFKTSLCTNFVKFGKCAMGEKCRYAHGEGELRIKKGSASSDQSKMNSSYKTAEPQNQFNSDFGGYQNQKIAGINDYSGMSASNQISSSQGLMGNYNEQQGASNLNYSE